VIEPTWQLFPVNTGQQTARCGAVRARCRQIVSRFSCVTIRCVMTMECEYVCVALSRPRAAVSLALAAYRQTACLSCDSMGKGEGGVRVCDWVRGRNSMRLNEMWGWRVSMCVHACVSVRVNHFQSISPRNTTAASSCRLPNASNSARATRSWLFNRKARRACTSVLAVHGRKGKVRTACEYICVCNSVQKKSQACLHLGARCERVRR
jgi:hypothetical protein